MSHSCPPGRLSSQGHRAGGIPHRSHFLLSRDLGPKGSAWFGVVFRAHLLNTCCMPGLCRPLRPGVGRMSSAECPAVCDTCVLSQGTEDPRLPHPALRLGCQPPGQVSFKCH